ncbi:MAG: spore cortex-lytic enzyme [Acutalibacteraceae bacterium]
MKKRLFIILLLFPVAVMLCTAVSSNALSKQGSRGDEVTAIQTKLRESGYYNGKIDGVFGSGTKNALISFQKDNGLAADGIAGTKTLQALGITADSGNGEFTQSEISLLARIISAESRGEPYEGQVAVGAVILNRIAHPSFPNTLAGVIYQPGAFSCLDDGQVNEPVSESAERAARDAMNGWDPTGGAIYYFNPNTATSKWIWSRPVITVIGSHRFCS